MTVGNRMAVVAATAALAGGLAAAAPAAHAGTPAPTIHTVQAQSQAVPDRAAAKWHTIWQSKFKPRRAKWVSGAFGVRAHNVTVKYQCWNGGDGTKAKARLVEADYPYRTLGTHSASSCNGTWWTFNSTRVKPHTSYKVVIEQNHGRAHTEQAGVYQYY
jgi:hypothetical protein